jgi:hypothetical protein
MQGGTWFDLDYSFRRRRQHQQFGSCRLTAAACTRMATQPPGQLLPTAASRRSIMLITPTVNAMVCPDNLYFIMSQALTDPRLSAASCSPPPPDPRPPHQAPPCCAGPRHA